MSTFLLIEIFCSSCCSGSVFDSHVKRTLSPSTAAKVCAAENYVVVVRAYRYFCLLLNDSLFHIEAKA